MVGPEDPTRMRLLDAAGAEFAANGFECARIRKICKRAGANVSAVNYHFGDKSELYVAAVLHAHRCGASADDDDGSSLGPPPGAATVFHLSLSDSRAGGSCSG